MTIPFNDSLAAQWLSDKGEAGAALAGKPSTLIVIYSYGDFRAASKVLRSDDRIGKPIEISRESCVPANKVVAFLASNTVAYMTNALFVFTGGRHERFKEVGLFYLFSTASFAVFTSMSRVLKRFEFMGCILPGITPGMAGFSPG